MLACKAREISLQKAGNAFSENEDAFRVSRQVEGILKFAISDGATESSFSREWATQLVSLYETNSFDKASILETIEMARVNWNSLLQGIELPWFAQQKLQQGAYASFLGLTLDFLNENWSAVAIGDSNLFIIRNNTLIKSYPISNSGDFGSTPFLVSTLKSQNSALVDLVCYDSGQILKGDLFILGTDAIAAWLLSENEQSNQPWISIRNLVGDTEASKVDFQNWLNNKRKEKQIKNDDTTLIVIEIF